jgi:ComF family protein
MAAGASNSTESAAAPATNLTAGRPPHWLRTSLSAAADLLFPPRCGCCGEDCVAQPGTPILCSTCSAELAPSNRPTCTRCAMPCSDADAAAGDCYDCRGTKLQFAQARSLGSYDGPLRQAVLKIKHYQHEPLARALGSMLAEELRRRPFPEPCDLVVPVPLHWLQRMWRGTSTTSTLARSVARSLGLRVSGQLVCRRMLRRQHTLPAKERRENVKGAFRVSWARGLQGARVLLVDDVMTSRATANEAARALLAAGAASVCVATVARGTSSF